jgi:hypothetical protein
MHTISVRMLTAAECALSDRLFAEEWSKPCQVLDVWASNPPGYHNSSAFLTATSEEACNREREKLRAGYVRDKHPIWC